MYWSCIAKDKHAHTYLHRQLFANSNSMLRWVSEQHNNTSCALKSRWHSWVTFIVSWRLQVLEVIFATDLRTCKLKRPIPVTPFLYPGLYLVLWPFQNGVRMKLMWNRVLLFLCHSEWEGRFWHALQLHQRTCYLRLDGKEKFSSATSALVWNVGRKSCWDYLEGYGAEAMQKIEVKRSVSRHIVCVKLCFYISSVIQVPGIDI